MLKLHLNGDLVASPDGAGKKTPKKRFCPYNLFVKCETGKYMKETNLGCETCQAFKSKLCPYAKAEDRTQKKFRVTYKEYRRLFGAALKAVAVSGEKMIFVTLTFPEWKDRPITEQQANKCFSKYIENLRKNYRLSNYIAVRERGEDVKGTNRLHFHLLMTIPYTQFSKLNRAWCHAISEYCYYAPNALTTRKGKIVVHDPIKAVRYCAKYFSKARGQESLTRLIFTNHNLTDLTANVSDYEVNSILSGFRYQRKQITDFCVYYKVDFEQSEAFIVKVVLPLFGLSLKRSGAVKFRQGHNLYGTVKKPRRTAEK
jgi:hypothetical protein